MKKLFGTDGIRGLANEYPMTAEMALRVGRAVAAYFAEAGAGPKIIIGKDTRLSGDMFEAGLVAGVCAGGGSAHLAGILPTPGVAVLAAGLRASAGVVISASHNPYYDNGIKIFKGDGYKLSDETEIEIEKIILDQSLAVESDKLHAIGTVQHYDHARADYISFLKNTQPPGKPCRGIKIALDCSNGATYGIAPQLFAELGADVESLAVKPDGRNINNNCGSEHPQALTRTVLNSKADIGLAFDGDGDRLIAVDENGRVLSGDHILAICARHLKQKGMLKNNFVVSTVMSNMGLAAALKEMQIDHEAAPVGDRYVMQRMLACGAVLGGEDSGHMIFADCHTTGDGVLTALKLIEAVQSEKKPLSELSRIMTVYPQVLVNVEVGSKPDIESVPPILEAIRSVESALGGQGRVLVRYSGTQPLCRVMVEGPDESKIRRHCEQISDIISNTIGI